MISDIEAYRTLFKADLSKLPDGMIDAIYAGIKAEWQKRRQVRGASRTDAKAFESANLKRFRGLSKPHHQFNHHWFKYLPTLLEQDWSNLFSGGDTERKYYVYLHSKNTGNPLRFVHNGVQIKTLGTPFYVGKGTGDRAYDFKRNQGHGQTLASMMSNGASQKDIVSIVRERLSEDEALELESKLIYFFGTKYEAGRRGILVNLDIPARPEFN